ncbi:CCR4-NOT transcription complex subunit 10 isoform X1 [Selaginella moellendorffii]|uniref:CCR4-NOT transcription complex subunit 10 isoform X1 n=1 Tax=Selaginella moellendorffii TaxID=88036 RepID=UPI000D1CF64D|nr:CCR4-NOT transcription complex subunit 10 isoform X1 [Selaginella moellendorffii]|eukprot:XP_024526215.1 CCR4-NOT transcription complex subunit 10 isoform X1 [Selaginella moellendorffii]
MEGESEGEVSMSQREAGISPAVSPGDESGTNAGSALAKEAAALYEKKSYQECLSLLQQILAKKESDPKVIHNIALAEFYRDGCTDPYKLLDVLEQVKQRKCEELARAADEQLEGIGNNVASPNGSTTGNTIVKPSPPEGSYIEDYDLSIPTLNTAIVYYHLKQYASAFHVVEPLFANIEPVDESCALQICLLMLDIALASRKAESAALVLHYVEKSYGLGQSGLENAANVQQLSVVAPTLAASSVLDGKYLGITSSPAPPLVTSPIGEGSSLTQGSGEETFEEDALSIGLEIDGSHSVRSLPTRVPAIEKSHPAPGTELKLLMHLYRVRFLLLTHCLKTVKREVKSALNLSKDNITALLLKAQLEYLRGNYRKAMKLLTTCIARAENAVVPMILSNLGCVYHYLRKDQTAALFFAKALQRYSSMSKERPLKLTTFSQDKSLSVYYNCGVVQLLSGNPVMASRLLQESYSMFYTRPLFWLRLAECCISALEKGLLTDVSARKEEVKVVVVGKGKFRRLVLPSGGSNPSLVSGTQPDNVDGVFPQDGKEGKPITLSMAIAKRFLQYAFLLLERDGKPEELAAGTETEALVMGNSEVSPSSGGQEGRDAAATLASFTAEEKLEAAMIRVCVLVDLAFVELCLENPLAALSNAEAALQQHHVTKAYSFLAHVYAAEALCLLDRIKEAEGHLEKCMMDWTSSSGDFLEEDTAAAAQKNGDHNNGDASSGGEDGSTRNLKEQVNFARFTGTQARASLYVNFAAIHAMQGELLQARQCALQALAIAPGSSMAVLAMVYVELSQGRTKEAVTMLKRCRRLSVSRLGARAGM